MLLGNFGLVTVVASLVLGFAGTGGRSAALRLGVLVVGLVVLFVVTRTDRFEQLVKRMVRFAARRWTGLEVRDYVQLLDVSEGYAIHDVTVREGDWLADTELRELDLPAEGVPGDGTATAGRDDPPRSPRDQRFGWSTKFAVVVCPDDTVTDDDLLRYPVALAVHE